MSRVYVMGYEVGECVRETIGPEHDRVQHETVVTEVFEDGVVLTESGNLYDALGFAYPPASGPSEYRSIRRLLLKNDQGGGA